MTDDPVPAPAAKRTLRALLQRLSRGGLCVASAYGLVVLSIYAAVAASSTPSDLGFGWLLVAVLALPWSGLGDGLLWPGFAANFLAMYLLGWLLDSLWQRVLRVR